MQPGLLDLIRGIQPRQHFEGVIELANSAVAIAMLDVSARNLQPETRTVEGECKRLQLVGRGDHLLEELLRTSP